MMQPPSFARIAEFPRVVIERDGLRRSVVALVVVAHAGELCVLLTRRSRHLRNHPGQYALPGGKIEPGESYTDCVLRELAEELGLDLPVDSVLGVLDDYATRSGFVMTPVVLWAADRFRALRPDAREVAEVFHIPLTELGSTPTFVTTPSSDDPVIRLPLLGRFVHAPTGAVLHQFGELAVHGRVTRVVHYDAPVFAWQ